MESVRRKKNTIEKEELYKVDVVAESEKRRYRKRRKDKNIKLYKKMIYYSNVNVS